MMIRLSMLLAVLALALAGCSLFSGGTDPAVEKARIEASESVADARKAKADLADAVDRLGRGEGTIEQVQAAEARYKASLDTLDEKKAALEAAVDAAARKGSDLGSWGATIGGAVFGPVGAAIGGVAGTIAAGFVAWRRGKSLRGVVVGIQAAREDLHKSAPAALAASDEAMRKAIPKELQIVIDALKKKYGLKITG